MTNRRFAAKGLSQDEINGATIMLLLNYRHGEVVDDFLADLARAVDDVAAGRIESRGEQTVYAV